MGWLIAAGSVIGYALIGLVTFRVIYTRRIEAFYKFRLGCRYCETELDYYGRGASNQTICGDCAKKQRALKEPPALAGSLWPFALLGISCYYVGKYVALAAKKIAFPSGDVAGVKTPSKLAWQARLQEARIERKQIEIDKEVKRLRTKELEREIHGRTHY